MHKIGEIDVVSIGLIEFHLSGNWLFATRPDKKIALEDSAIKVRVDPKSGVKSYYIDGDLFGFEEGRTIPVPSSILKTRDQMRENRAAEHSRLMLRKIGEALYPQGVIEFFIFVDI